MSRPADRDPARGGAATFSDEHWAAARRCWLAAENFDSRTRGALRRASRKYLNRAWGMESGPRKHVEPT